MWKNILRVMAATSLFALVHSALASRKAKEMASQVLGERRRNAFYRPMYIGHSLVTFGSLVIYIRWLPARMLYEVRGPVAGLMQVIRVASLGYAAHAAYHVGISEMLGWPGIISWWRGEAVVPPEPAAQGPARSGPGGLNVRGPFLVSRHPLNLAPLPVLWLSPRMTANLLAFNCVATLYLAVGSMHEEHRLRVAYGQPYVAYQRSGIPFYLPNLGKPIRNRDRKSLVEAEIPLHISRRSRSIGRTLPQS